MKEKLQQTRLFVKSLRETLQLTFRNVSNEWKIIRDKLQDLSTTNYNLGIDHLARGNLLDAKFRLHFSIKLRDNFASAYYHLARCYLYELKFSQAEEFLNKAIELDSSINKARSRLSILKRQFQDSEVPIEIIEEDADSLAKTYEKMMLEQMQYSAPEKLSEVISSLIDDKDQELKCLDLGCGTGLTGAFLKEKINLSNLVGVDISKKALALAMELEKDGVKLYTQTLNKNFTNFALPKDKFDIIVACNSFGYCQDIESQIKHIEQFSKKGSFFGLVLLKAEKSDIEFNYNYACFSFSEDFLNKAFKKHKWTVEFIEEFDMYSEKVTGLLFVVKK